MKCFSGEPMKRKAPDPVRMAIVEHAVRWASNILIEVQGNHSRVLSEGQRKCLRTAVDALSDFTRED